MLKVIRMKASNQLLTLIQKNCRERESLSKNTFAFYDIFIQTKRVFCRQRMFFVIDESVLHHLKIT